MKKNKGFQRSQKEWEESIAGHIGKFVDRLKADDAFSLLAYAFAGWMGATSFQKFINIKEPYRSVGGFATGIVALKMALAPTAGLIPITNTVGLMTLGGMGIFNLNILDMIKSSLFRMEINIHDLLGGLGLAEALGISDTTLGIQAEQVPSTPLLGIGGIPEKEPYPGYYPWWHV